MDIQNFTAQSFTKFDHDWAILTAGNKDDFNSMTISWGGLGTLWNKPVAFLFVKPTRYTFEFVSKHDEITISFYDKEYKKALAIFGSKSGRDIDKASATGFTPKFLDHGVTYEQAKETIVCKKLFMQQLDKSKFPESVLDFYNGRGEKELPPHYFVVAEVTDILS